LSRAASPGAGEQAAQGARVPRAREAGTDRPAAGRLGGDHQPGRALAAPLAQRTVPPLRRAALLRGWNTPEFASTTASSFPMARLLQPGCSVLRCTPPASPLVQGLAEERACG